MELHCAPSVPFWNRVQQGFLSVMWICSWVERGDFTKHTCVPCGTSWLTPGACLICFRETALVSGVGLPHQAQGQPTARGQVPSHDWLSPEEAAWLPHVGNDYCEFLPPAPSPLLSPSCNKDGFSCTNHEENCSLWVCVCGFLT